MFPNNAVVNLSQNINIINNIKDVTHAAASVKLFEMK